MHPTLNIAVKAARRAGTIINRASMDVDKLRVDVKQQSDYVTEVDRAAEAAILEVLREAYPTHGILAEESGLAGTSADCEYQWIIDPLDGTTNFIHGLPQYAISIGLSSKRSWGTSQNRSLTVSAPITPSISARSAAVSGR